MDGARDHAIDAREQRLTTTMMAVAIAAHIGPRSECGDDDGMMFCGYLIPADETAGAGQVRRLPPGDAHDHLPRSTALGLR
jgi:hypothetical protein